MRLLFPSRGEGDSLIKWMGRVLLVAGSFNLRRTLTGFEHFLAQRRLGEATAETVDVPWIGLKSWRC